MSIASVIQNKQQQVAAAYSACNNKGATMPEAENRNLTNLASTISTIETPIPINQQIQKWIRTDTETSTYTRECETVSANYTTIPTSKFQSDTTLVSVLIPDTVTIINPHAFHDCTRLKYINLENIQKLYAYAFQTSSSLCIDVNLPNLTNLYEGLHFSGSGICKISSLGSVTAIPGQFALNCPNLTTINLGNSNIQSIGAHAFRQCKSLKSAYLPTTLTSIGEYAFGYVNTDGADTFLDTISGLDNVTYIGNGGFSYCSKLAISVSLPHLVSTGGSVFANTPITSVTNLGEITEVANSCFSNCSSLTSVVLPSTVTTINNNAFYTDGALTTVSCSGQITFVGQYAFYNCSQLSSIFSLQYLETVKTHSFQGSGISGNLDLPNATSIETYAFHGTQISKILSLGSITILTNNLFQNCYNLTEATLPSTLESIQNNAFWSDTALTTVTVLATTPPTLGNSVFQHCSSLVHIYVPSASVTDYQGATGWSAYASIISAIP